MYFSLSWRNIWRNKKRTLIVAGSVFFAVLLAVVMRSMQLGSYAYMIDSSARLFTGHLQLQGTDYWENRSLDKSFHLPAQELEKIQHIKHTKHITPRLEAFALVSHDSSTRVSQVIGIDPQSEDAFTGLKKRLNSGEYLTAADAGALVGEGMARLLHLEVGDTIILYGQGYHGQIAAAAVAVKGLVKMPIKPMNDGLVFLSLPNAQEIFWTGDRITSLPILVEETRFLAGVLEEVKQLTTDNYTVMTWEEMLPEVRDSIESDNAGGIIMLAILYVVIGFGVLGTIMMMVAERVREFSILISVGMRRWKLVLATTLETLMVSFIGFIAGLLCSVPMILYLKQTPIHLTGDAAKIYDKLGIEAIMGFSADPTILTSQAQVILIIALIAAIYPWLYIRKIDPAKTLHG